MSQGKWSAITVLRAWGGALDPEAIVAKHGLQADADTWKAGDVGRCSRVHDDAGFVLAISRSSSKQELVESLWRFVEEGDGLLADLAAAGARVLVDIGLMVYAMSPRGVTFEPDLLARLGARGVALEVSGYPCSDDDEPLPDA